MKATINPMPEEDKEYPVWMLQDGQNPELAEKLNIRALEAYGQSKGITAPAVNLGKVTYKDAKGVEHEQNLHMVHAVDTILTDGKRVLVIERKGEPDKDKIALIGGLIDQPRHPLQEGDVIDIRDDAARELKEEANGEVLAGAGVVIGENRLIARQPRDIRIVSGDSIHYKNVENLGVKPNDLMLVTTQAVLFQVSPEQLDKMESNFKAGTDARADSARLENIQELLQDKKMGLDHGTLLQQAVDYMAEKEKVIARSNSIMGKVSAIVVGAGARVAGTFALAGNMIRKAVQTLEDVHVIRDLTTRVNATIIGNTAQKLAQMGESFNQVTQELSVENKKKFNEATDKIINSKDSDTLADALTEYGTFVTNLPQKDIQKIIDLDKLGDKLVKAKNSYMQLVENEQMRQKNIQAKDQTKTDHRASNDQRLAEIPGVKEMRENITIAKKAAYTTGEALLNTGKRIINNLRGGSNER